MTFFGSEPFCVTVGKKIASNVMMFFFLALFVFLDGVFAGIAGSVP